MRIFTKTSIALAVSILVLQGCGGGGGGGSPSPIVRPSYDVPYYTPTRIGSLQITSTPTVDATSNIIYTQDLTGNGSEHVIITGQMSQATVHDSSNWTNSKITIFGWSNGQLVNQTSQWFSGNDNEILGAHYVKFGDFTGDGKISMFVPANTDNPSLTGNGAVFINSGSSFTKHTFNLYGSQATDAVVQDFNGDGKSDILVTDYGPNLLLAFSNGNGTFTTYRNQSVNPWSGGSAIATADFMGNGSSQAIIVDTGYWSGNTRQDNKLFSFAPGSGSSLVVTELATLPVGRFDLPRWASYNFGNATSDVTKKATHNVAVVAFDFDNSGRPSAVVVSRPGQTNGVWPIYSEVQFLKNQGNGIFVDVTDTTLLNYNYATPASYNPKLIDFNGDGLTDIFMSGSDGVATVARVLVHTSTHQFVDSYLNVFSAFHEQSANQQALQGWIKSTNNSPSIIRGPNNELYMITMIEYSANGGIQQAVYLSKIGTQTTSAQALSTAIRQAWPYMSSAQVNSVISSSSTTWFGLNIIDPEKALSPIGGLGFKPNQNFNGYLGGVNLNNINMPVYMFDSIGRNFAVNLAPTAPTNLLNAWARQVENIADDTRGAQLMSMPMTSYNGLKFGGDSNTRTMAFGITGVNVGKGIELSAQYTELPFSPFIQMMGSYGSVRGSTMLETTLTHKSEGWVTKAGLMYSNTQFDAGAVTRISPITSVWTEVGYEGEKFKFYAGMLPKVVAGSVDLRLPTGVDAVGNIQYNSISARVTNPTTEYIRLSYKERLHKGVYFNLHAMTTTQKQTSVLGELKINF